ncbi:MAG: hypothetical protein KQI78_12155 [Deltaproteobacteria bacterium]|nr:hypothetical protein [Deltaproteobacteria bacterium]
MKTDESKLDKPTQLMCQLIDDLLIPVEIEDVAEAHSAEETEIRGIELGGFLGPCKSYNRTYIPEIQIRPQRKASEYMETLDLGRFAIRDRLITLTKRFDGNYLVRCIDCGHEFKTDTAGFQGGLCERCHVGKRWVSVSDIEIVVPCYSSGAKVIKQHRAYVPG